MDNEIMNGHNPFEIFDYKNLGQVRTQVDQYGNPWFCLKDVCDILGIVDAHKVMGRIDTPYRASIPVGVQTGIYADGVTPVIQNVN